MDVWSHKAWQNKEKAWTMKVGEVSGKVNESRLKWYGHVIKSEDKYEDKRLMMDVPGERRRAGLYIGLVGPVARGASRFENLLAPQKTYWPPKKLTGPYLKTKLARRKTICINLQFAHRPIIKLFRSHPRNIFVKYEW